VRMNRPSIIPREMFLYRAKVVLLVKDLFS